MKAYPNTIAFQIRRTNCVCSFLQGSAVNDTIANPALSRGKIPSLDGLRGISFLIVFLSHAGLANVIPGRLGVNIFFLLSGYLITTLMIRERERTGWISLKLFYLRRSLRIFPPMYTIMAATLLYLAAVHHLGGVTLAGVCSQAFYFQNYYFHDGRGLIRGMAVLWSLAVEEHFYLLFPLLMLLFTTKFKMSYRQIAVALLCMCGTILVWRTFVALTFSNGLDWARDATDCRADSILFGCALASWERTPSIARVFTHKRLVRRILPASLALLLLTLVYRNPVFRETIRYSIQGVALAPILYFFVHAPHSWIGRILNTRVLTTLGILSYALYLLHVTVLIELSQVISSKLLAGILGLFVSILLAYLVHLFVEKPTDAMRKKFRHNSGDHPNEQRSQRNTAIALP